MRVSYPYHTDMGNAKLLSAFLPYLSLLGPSPPPMNGINTYLIAPASNSFLSLTPCHLLSNHCKSFQLVSDSTLASTIQPLSSQRNHFKAGFE